MKFEATKGLQVCLALYAFAACAQPAGNIDVVSKLTADLLSLKSVLTSDEPLKDEVYSRDELRGLESVGQYKVMRACQSDLFFVLMARTREAREPDDAFVSFVPFFSTDLAYKLTWALAGKDLSESTLRVLSEGIVGINESALDCSLAHCRLQDSPAFRNSVQMAWGALQTLGVKNRDLNIVADALFRAAQSASSPPARGKYK